VPLSLQFLICVVAAATGTMFIRNLALRHNLLDEPGSRSSHTVATPRGGGLALALVVIVIGTFGALVPVGTADSSMLAIIFWSSVVATLGFADDRFQLSPRRRFAVQVGAATGLVLSLSPPASFGPTATVFACIAAVVGTTWGTNFYNFMDGIDGIAGMQAVFMASAAAWILGGNAGVATMTTLVAIAGAGTGFLLWNWQPARIFMGDVGSAFLGFIFSGLAVASWWQDPPALWVWVILGGAFVSDATVTLLTRLRIGERVTQPHRSHAYQRLARRMSSHARATCVYLGVNVLWLLPLASVAYTHPDLGPWAAVVALGPIVAAVIGLGAGRRDHD
jgi:Fuc2NAc and GlcNAc transferase